MPKVYAIQRQYRASRDKSELVPKFDLSPAEKFGELVYLLGPTAAPWRIDLVVEELHEKLRDFTEDSWLLLIGNPILIAVAATIAADRTGGTVKFLQWSGRSQSYVSIKAQIFDDDSV